MGTAFPYMLRHVRYGDGLVGMPLDILDAFVDILGGIVGNLSLRHTVRNFGWKNR